MTSQVEGLALVERAEAHGRTRLVLADASGATPSDACSLTIDVVELHDGAGGLVTVGGIGNVATLESHRRRGLATKLLHVAIERMRDRGMSGSLLYGIDHFYDPLGWVSCGDERWVRIGLDAWREASPREHRCTARPMRDEDREPLATAYEQIAASMPGAAARTGDRAWSRLDVDEVFVVERDGLLVGWAWRGRGMPEREDLARQHADAVAFAELQAVDQPAMLAVVAAACELAGRDDQHSDAGAIVVGACEQHALRELARADMIECRLIDEVRPHGGPMLLAFDERANALLGSGGLYQFLPDRF